MGISLNRLNQKKLRLGINKLANAGLDVERWLAMCDAYPAEIQRLMETWPDFLPSYVHDAKATCGVLGLPNHCVEKAPKAARGEVVVWYGGWTIGELCATGKVCNYLSREREAWKAPPGYYHARIPVPDSDRMTHEQHVDLLQQLYASFKEMPTPVGATALAAHLGITGKDLLKGNFCRCAEALPDGLHATVCVREGRVCVDWDCCRGISIFLGAARMS